MNAPTRMEGTIAWGRKGPKMGLFLSQIRWIWRPVGRRAGGIRVASNDALGSETALQSGGRECPILPKADVQRFGNDRDSPQPVIPAALRRRASCASIADEIVGGERRHKSGQRCHSEAINELVPAMQAHPPSSRGTHTTVLRPLTPAC